MAPVPGSHCSSQRVGVPILVMVSDAFERDRFVTNRKICRCDGVWLRVGPENLGYDVLTLAGYV
jgi:hypothetical protein